MTQPRPNVLFLISDQHNRNIAGFAGNTIVQTPNLDRLASESAQFDNAYCQFPLCTPSRISMWTGRLPRRTGGLFNYAPILPEHRTIPEHFAEHGYVTCGVGKMHVGGLTPPGPPLSRGGSAASLSAPPLDKGGPGGVNPPTCIFPTPQVTYPCSAKCSGIVRCSGRIGA